MEKIIIIIQHNKQKCSRQQNNLKFKDIKKLLNENKELLVLRRLGNLNLRLTHKIMT